MSLTWLPIFAQQWGRKYNDIEQNQSFMTVYMWCVFFIRNIFGHLVNPPKLSAGSDWDRGAVLIPQDLCNFKFFFPSLNYFLRVGCTLITKPLLYEAEINNITLAHQQLYKFVERHFPLMN